MENATIAEVVAGQGGSARTVFEVPAENVERLRARIVELNKRASRLAKRGYPVEPIVINVGDLKVRQPEVDQLQSALDFEGRAHARRVGEVYAVVELVAPKPSRVEGWQFVAVLSHVEEVGTVLRVCPGADVAEGELKRYRQADPKNCDHCHLARRRNDTFVLRDASGSLRQVGRQCLSDYTGIADPWALCEASEILCSAGELLEDSEREVSDRGGPRYSTIESYLPFVACSIREDGWLSRRAARAQGKDHQATANLAQSCGLFASPQQRTRYMPSEADYELARKAIDHCREHFEGCDVDALSDYENSLRVAMASGILRPGFEGIVASSIIFYQRDLERRAQRSSFSERAARSTHQGVVKERRVFEALRVEYSRVLEGDFGPKYLYAMSDPQDNMFAYFSTRDMGLEPGQVVSLRGTVKEHKVRTTKGGPDFKQTVLTRCTLCARATVTSHELRKADLGKRVRVTDTTEAQQSFYAQHTCVLETVHDYVLTAEDGQQFLIRSKSKKRELVVGAAAHVEYEARKVKVLEDDQTGASKVVPTSDEGAYYPASLVGVLEPPGGS